MRAKYVNQITENNSEIYRDLKNVIDTAGDEGERRGERGALLKAAKALKDSGIEFDIITKATGLSEKEIEQL